MSPAVPARILLVDDQPANLAVLEAILSGLADSLVAVESGEAALRALLEHEFALVLLDVQMPTLDGFETAELIRQHPRARTVPIIFLTAGDADGAPFERAWSLGAADYITKPLHAQSLRAKAAVFVDLFRKNAALMQGEQPETRRSTQRSTEQERERRERAGRKGFERIRLILDNLHDYAVIGTDEARRITSWEGGAEAITGWSALEACGQSADMIFVPEDRAAGRPDEEAASARETGRAEDRRWHLRRDGSLFFADGVMIPLYEDGAPGEGAQGEGTPGEGSGRGVLRGYAKIMRDATAEHEAAERLASSERALDASTQRMHDIFYQAPAFMAVMRGPELVFEMANERFATLVGQRPLLGLPLHAALPEMAGQGFFELLEDVYRSGEAHQGSNVRLLLQTDGALETYYIDFVYMALREADGAVSGVLVHGVDVTERTRATLLTLGQRGALELAVSNAPLDDVLDLLARTAEEYAGGAALAGIQLAEPGAGASRRLRHAAAPSLPPALQEALDGLGIAPLGAAGGTAAWRAEAVDCPDIATDPLWEAARGPALEAGLHACRALPILAPSGAVLGAFTWYYRAVRDERNLAAMALLANTASLVIGQREEALARRAAEERSDVILESMTDGFLAMDSAWRIGYANGAAERITGFQRHDLMDQVFWDLFPEWQGSSAERACRRCALERAGERLDAFLPAWGGWYEISCFPTPGGGIALYLRDQSERRQAEEGIRRLAAVAEQSPDFIGIFGPEGAGLYLNPAGRAMGGIDPGAPIGDVRLIEFFARDCRPFVRAEVLPALTGPQQKWEGELQFAPRSGSDPLPVYFKGFAVHGADGAHLGLATITRDFTEQKRAENELRRIAADLSEADHRKSEFLATLAHELRNPLAPIRTGLDLLRMAPGDAATVARVYGMMDRQLGQLIHLVDDLLDIARITRGRIELKKEPVDLRAAVSMAVETSSALVEAGGHTLEVDLPDAPLPLFADLTRLVQVLANLLNNAAKYTPAGGRIRVSSWREEDQAFVAVSDSGVGIAPEAIGSVFDMFTQVRSSLDRAQGGLGIGLSLVRRLVELHGGRVQAASAGPGQGSTFTVSLPLRRGDLLGREEGAAGAGTGHAPALRVLVVDDNVDAAESLAALLKALGHETRMAHDGPRGLQAALEFRPDLAFLDIGLPGMNGHELARALRSNPELKALVLVALTGWGATSDMTLSHGAGFDQHLTKPVSLEGLAQALAAATQAHESGGA
ncbi:response regulator [Massilia niabensis]|uniref:histidine kinase n=1 Tax=Massilia niabensis TaxID=544910 RepID=A0ABW0LBB2_9BURK